MQGLVPTIEHPNDGIVIIRGALTLDEQLRVIDVSERNCRFKDAEGNWNFFGKRGREFMHLDKYTDKDGDSVFLKTCFERFKHIAVEADRSLDWASATHLLTFWYPSKQGIKWHIDSDKGGNDGDPGAPVYSLTVGNTCVFEYYLVGGAEEAKEGEKPKKCSVELASGDLIVFGGPQRLMMHQVKKIVRGSFIHKSDFDARLNLTYRTLSSFTEDDEEKYNTANYVSRLLQTDSTY